MTVRAAVFVPLWLLAAGCAPEAEKPSPGTAPRTGRFGSLRDLVLIERSDEGRTVSLFVDRFEVTRGDWAQFAVTPEGRAVDADRVSVSDNPALPVTGVDLRQARAFAHWRFCRLPRRVEWEAAIGDGRHPYPWGSREDWTRANAGELGLGQAMPVGTFESGRAGPLHPYDLIGNVSEWTESVPLRWIGGDLDPSASCAEGRRRVMRTPSLAVWRVPGAGLPLVLAVAAGGDAVPREVVGADFQGSMAVPDSQTFVPPEAVLAGERRQRTGLRVYATPQELLRALLRPGVLATPEDGNQLRRFIRRGANRAALEAVWRDVADGAAGDGLVLRVLREELGS